MTLVIDTSVTMAWCFEDEASAATDGLLDRVAAEGAIVPSIWIFEVANVLLVAQRRERITVAGAAAFIDDLRELPIDINATDAGGSIAALVSVGNAHALSAYDAAYIDCAARLGAELATLDGRLSDAARAIGIGTIP